MAFAYSPPVTRYSPLMCALQSGYQVYMTDMPERDETTPDPGGEDDEERETSAARPPGLGAAEKSGTEEAPEPNEPA
jgi:hypothetical protein